MNELRHIHEFVRVEESVWEELVFGEGELGSQISIESRNKRTSNRWRMIERKTEEGDGLDRTVKRSEIVGVKYPSIHIMNHRRSGRRRILTKQTQTSQVSIEVVDGNIDEVFFDSVTGDTKITSSKSHSFCGKTNEGVQDIEARIGDINSNDIFTRKKI